MSYSVKDVLNRGIDSNSTGITPKKLFLFLAASHDIGKATPVFQYRDLVNKDVQDNIRSRLESAGVPPKPVMAGTIHHSLSSYYIFDSAGFDTSICVIVGGHHGIPPTYADLDKLPQYPSQIGFLNDAWKSIWAELFDYCAQISDIDLEDLKTVKINVQSQALLTGLLIMADWMSSDSSIFTYDVWDDSRFAVLSQRKDFVRKMPYLPLPWEPDVSFSEERFRYLFGFEPRLFQLDVGKAAFEMRKPGLMIVEASMGEGKTEAALFAAEILASKFHKSGVFFALPTQATADGIFDRTISWVNKAIGDYGPVHTLFLAHGKSAFNKTYSDIRKKSDWNVGGDRSSSVIVSDWMKGRKKGLLSDFSIGTIDQLLMVALQQKHLALRHLSFANKVVIIDECHAYDEYMCSYLCRALEWLGTYDVPVIVMSATLHQDMKAQIQAAYAGKRRSKNGIIPEWASDCSYPLITTFDDDVRTCKTKTSRKSVYVKLRHMADSDVVSEAVSRIANGGVVGIILNTVSKVQALAHEMEKSIGEDHVFVLHSRFMDIDRTENERAVISMIRNCNRRDPQQCMVVIGTQVMEQSLDLDFDLMFTDLCPMDLLLQRIGRLHRHIRDRSELMAVPECVILHPTDGRFDKGSVAVYGKYHLFNTEAIVGKAPGITVPDDIRGLVSAAYDQDCSVPVDEKEEYAASKRAYEVIIKNKENDAEVFQIFRPKNQSLLNWIYADVNPQIMQASVRDINESVEVLVVQRKNGAFHLVSWVGGDEIPDQGDLSEALAFTLAGCRIRLPRFGGKSVSDVVSWLESTNADIPKNWSGSFWLSDELYLILDENMSTKYEGYELRLDKRYGMEVAIHGQRVQSS